MQYTAKDLKELARQVAEAMAKHMLENGEVIPLKDTRQAIADSTTYEFMKGKHKK